MVIHRGNDSTKWIYFSGATGENVEHRNGVGLLIIQHGTHFRKNTDSMFNVTLIQCYAPTEANRKTKKEEYYQQWSDTIRKVGKNDIIMMIGDMNAKIGSNNEGPEHVMGQHGIGEMNENGKLFVNLCASYDLLIEGSLFIHKKCNKVTWISIDHSTKNQTDHIAISRRFRRSVTNKRNRRGADLVVTMYSLLWNILIQIYFSRVLCVL